MTEKEYQDIQTRLRGKLYQEKYKGRSYVAALESMEGQFGLWDKASALTSNAADSMMENLASQKEYWENYAQNLATMEANLSKLTDEQSAAIQGAFANMTEAQKQQFAFDISEWDVSEIANYADMLADVDAARKAGASMGAAVQVGLSEAMDGFEATAKELGLDNLTELVVSAFSDASTQLLESGEDAAANFAMGIALYYESAQGDAVRFGEGMGDGMVVGLESRSDALSSAATRIVNAALQAARDAADSHSPSRKMIEIFEDIGDGAVIGLSNKESEMIGAAEDFVGATADAFGDVPAEILDGFPDVPKEFFALGVVVGARFWEGFRTVLPGLEAIMTGGAPKLIVEHVGTIEMRGVTNSGEFVDASNIVISRMRSDARWR